MGGKIRDRREELGMTQREPYALLVGYRTEGAATRKWYRCKFPIEHPGPDAALNAILRSLGVWLGSVGR